MTNEIRASELHDGSIFREYGMDDVHKVAEIDWHGDTLLVTTESGDEVSLDRDTVVEDLNYAPVEIKGTVTLANGRMVEFSIGEVAGDITYTQWGATESTLYRTVDLMSRLVEAIHEDDLLVVIR